MRKNITGFFLIFFTLHLISCKEDKLDDFKIQTVVSSVGKAGGISGEIVKSNEYLQLPIVVHFSPSASKAFEVELSLDLDQAKEYISTNKVGDTHVAIRTETVNIPNSVKVDYGTDSTIFNLIVNRTEVERYFGKKIVIAYTLKSVSKGNSITQEGKSNVIVFNSEDVITSDDIHYLTLTNGGGEILELKNQRNYESSSTGLTTAIGISLASFPGSSFEVEIDVNTDTIAHLVNIGKLPKNTIALSTSDFTYDKKVKFLGNAKTAPLELNVPWSVINGNIDKKLAVLLKLKSSSLHVLHPEESQTVVLIDSENVIEIDVTNEGELSVSHENHDGADGKEGSKKLVDNNSNTKFLLRDFRGELWCQIEFDEAQKIGAYTMTSANDAENRDPNEWNLQGSDDGVSWTIVDKREREVFNQRFMTKRYDIQFAKAYKFYRLNITSNVGNNLFQLAEWRLIRIP